MKAQSQSRDLRCKARSNPWGFHRWHFKTEPHQRTGESGMKKRAYLKDNWRLVLLWLLTAGLTELVMYFFQVQAELMILTLGIWLLGLVGYEEEQVLPGAGRKDGEPGRKIPYPGNDKETGISGGKDSL